MQYQHVFLTALMLVVYGTVQPPTPCDCSCYAPTPGQAMWSGFRTRQTHCEVVWGANRHLTCPHLAGDAWKVIAKGQQTCNFAAGGYQGCCNRQCCSGSGPNPNTKSPTNKPTLSPTSTPTLTPTNSPTSVRYVVPQTCSSSRGDCARSIDGNGGTYSWMTRSHTCNSAVMSWSVTNTAFISGIELRTTSALGGDGSSSCLKFRVYVDGKRVQTQSGTINSVAQSVQPSGSPWDFNGFTPRNALSEIKWNPVQGKQVQITFANCHRACYTHWPISTLRFITGAAAVTKSPTSHPTKNPTSSPTRNPTKNPTSTPTRTPTSNPTKNPTSPPTCTPTSTPTSSPSKNPSMAPTLSPSPFPTAREFAMKIKGFHGSPESSLARIVFAQDKAEVKKINYDVQSIKTAKASTN